MATRPLNLKLWFFCNAGMMLIKYNYGMCVGEGLHLQNHGYMQFLLIIYIYICSAVQIMDVKDWRVNLFIPKEVKNTKNY